jgi:ethylbenzene dioxygenase alpha subunit
LEIKSFRYHIEMVDKLSMAAVEAPLFDVDTGRLQRLVYSDQEVFEREMGSIFGRVWLFLAHESQVHEDGDFATSYMGVQPVVLWRGADRKTRVFVNECLASMEKVVTAEDGNAEVFLCPCHRWPYSLDGWRDGRATAMLREVPSVASYRGLLFATFDPNAPGLETYLGDMSYYLDLLLDSLPGRPVIQGVVKSLINANWKLPVQSFTSDALDQEECHEGDASQICAGFGAVQAVLNPGESGLDFLRPSNGLLFPNLGIGWSTSSLHVFHPRGPRTLEVWTYCLAGADESEAQRRKRTQACNLAFGPAGIEHQNRTISWEQITAISAGTIARREPVTLQPSAPSRYHEELPGRLADGSSDFSLSSFYESWLLLLTEPDWQRVMAGVRAR